MYICHKFKNILNQLIRISIFLPIKYFTNYLLSSPTPLVLCLTPIVVCLLIIFCFIYFTFDSHIVYTHYTHNNIIIMHTYFNQKRLLHFFFIVVFCFYIIYTIVILFQCVLSLSRCTIKFIICIFIIVIVIVGCNALSV